MEEKDLQQIKESINKISNVLYASEISTFLKNYHQISDEIRTFKSYAKNLAKKTNDDKKSLDV